ncbi:hypothetical protein [Citrobacter sp. Marseille-Q6884]|uniref:hypothetical protein n=1 Tax=Citrobacter sp. Marseille-Q6884 TaxID=2956786 RepID=UPI0021B444E2|nr:hypothetical protein [Citrobacter sp. Marseille-Q6884]
MTPEQAKALQKQNARLRSKQTPRRSSQQAISSETQSEVTERAPNLYRVPQINVPDDLQGVARLIQKELQKIEASQSILLSLWEKVKSQTDAKSTIQFSKGIDIYTPNADQAIRMFRDDQTEWNYMEWRKKDDGTRDAYMGIMPDSRDMQISTDYSNINVSATNGEVIYDYMKRFYTDGKANNISWFYPENSTQEPITCLTRGTVINDPSRDDYLTGDMNYAPMNSVYFAYPLGNTTNGGPFLGATLDIASLSNGYRAQMTFGYSNNGICYRTHNGDSGTWAQWDIVATEASLEDMRLKVKAEVYAELLALNPGIVVPVVENTPQE